MTKDVKNIEFIERVDFEFIQNLPNNGTKYLSIVKRFPALNIFLKLQQREDIQQDIQHKLY